MEYYLAHYGVKGMKWGVRHERKTTGTGRKKAKKRLGGMNRQPKKSKNTEKKKRKRLRDMSDAEVKERIDRLKLEQSYKEAKRGGQKTQTARQFVGDIMRKSLKSAAQAVTTSVIKYALGSAVNKLVESKIPGGIVKLDTPKKDNKKDD